MLQPTKDSKLKQAIYNIIVENHDSITATQANDLTTKIATEFEKRGYHVGLPSNIEWALNSGDGVYRP